jgi:hypothetical protein
MFSGLRGGKRVKGGRRRGAAHRGPRERRRNSPPARHCPPGIEVQTYTDEVSVEQEVPVAREAVVLRLDLLNNLVNDVRLGGSFGSSASRVVEAWSGIVRNPALMWVARLRGGHLELRPRPQVSVYLGVRPPPGFPRRSSSSWHRWACSSTSANPPAQGPVESRDASPTKFESVKRRGPRTRILAETPTSITT